MNLLRDMGSDVDAPWESEVDIGIENKGDADFERRTGYLSLHDSSGEVPGKAIALAEEWGVSKNVAADRVARMYLAHVLDTHGLGHMRDDYDITTLIPPEGWCDQVESLDLDYESSDTESLNISTAPTVRDIIDDLCDGDDVDVETPADFLRQSINWIVED